MLVLLCMLTGHGSTGCYTCQGVRGARVDGVATGEAEVSIMPGEGADTSDAGFVQQWHIIGCSVRLRLRSSVLANQAGQAFWVPRTEAFSLVWMCWGWTNSLRSWVPFTQLR